MELTKLQQLLQEKSDLLWLMELRASNEKRKIEMVYNKPGLIVLHIAHKYYSKSDDSLQVDLLRLHSQIESGLAQIEIEDLKNILP